MLLNNLSIGRIIIHQIFQKTSDVITSPEKSSKYTNFDPAAMADFESRVVGAIGEGSKAVEMQILDQDEQDLPYMINESVNYTDEDFIEASYKIACKLAQAQFDKGRGVKGGIVVVFTGEFGNLNKKILGVMKAEIHSGYEKLIDPATGQISLKHIKDLLLTPNSKLFKTVGFCEQDKYEISSENLNDKWFVLIADNQISQTDGKVSAEYFYRKFAGCGYPQTSARTTKDFYDTTKGFILNLKRTPKEKNELLNALTTYLKVDKSPTINPLDFASTYFDTDTQDNYKNHLKNQNIPTSAFTKDTDHIKNQLKFHKVAFSNNVKIEADPETFEKDVIIEPIDGEPDENGRPQQWTKIIVKSDMITKK